MKGQLQKEDVKSRPPDGGWGWLVAFGGGLNHCLATCLVSSFSLVFSSFFAENFITSTTVAWIFSMNQCVWNTTTFFGGPLAQRYGWRIVAFCGGLSLALSVILSVFVTNPYFLFITFSIFTGIGQGLCVLISFVIVAHYFDKRKGIATGIVSVGNCFGHFLGPLLTRFLMENYGRQGAVLIWGGVLTHACVSALVFHPVEWHTQRAKTVLKVRPTKIPYSESSKPYLSESVAPESGLSDNVAKISRSTSEQLTNIEHSNNDTPLTEERKLFLAKVERVDRISRSQDIQIHSLDENYSHRRHTHHTIYFKNNNCKRLSLDVISSAWEISSFFNIIQESGSDKQLPRERKSASICSLIVKNFLLLRWHRVQIITLSVALTLSSYVNFVMLVPFAMTEQGYSMDTISWCLAIAGFCNLVIRIIVTTLTDVAPLSSKYYFMAGSLGIFLSNIMFTVAQTYQILLLAMALFGLSVGTCTCLLSIVILEFLGLEYLSPVLGLNGLLVALFFLILGPTAGSIRDTTESFDITIRVLAVAHLLSICLWLLMPLAISLDKRKDTTKTPDQETFGEEP